MCAEKENSTAPIAIETAAGAIIPQADVKPPPKPCDETEKEPEVIPDLPNAPII